MISCKVSLIRKYKLGDILSVEPVMQFLFNYGIKVEFVTSSLGKQLFSNYEYAEIKDSPSDDFFHIDLHAFEKGEVFNWNGKEIHILNCLYFGSLPEIFALVAGSKLKIKNMVDDLSFPKIPMKFEREVINVRNYIVVHRFSDDKSKISDIAYWNTLIKRLVDLGFFIVEIGGEDVANIDNGLKSICNYLDLRGELSILETAYLIRKAKLFLGIMSGPSHIANAVKTPGVILSRQYAHYDYHNPYMGFYRENGMSFITFFRKSINEIEQSKVLNWIVTLIEGNKTNFGIGKKKNYRNFYYIDKINKFIKHNDKFVIWGAGSFGKGVLNLIKNFGKEVICFIDSDKNKQFTFINDTIVYPPSKVLDILRKEGVKLIVASLWWTEIADFLKKIGLKRWYDYI